MQSGAASMSRVTMIAALVIMIRSRPMLKTMMMRAPQFSLVPPPCLALLSDSDRQRAPSSCHPPCSRLFYDEPVSLLL
eukprot:scaffold5602_cov161-Skeletonema_marinoi.AAC.3